MTATIPFGKSALRAALGCALMSSAMAGEAPLPAPAAAALRMATIEVDARQASRGILKAHVMLPVTPGPLTLVYPKWLPGRHSPAGPITSVAGPRLSAGGSPVNWRRDLVDPYAFHVEVPSGVTTLDADLEVLATPTPDGAVVGAELPTSATESLAIVEWNQLVLYPTGKPTDQLSYRASIRLPTDWHFATALRPGRNTTDGAEFEATSLTTLIDSTLLAGRYMRTIPLGGTPAVEMVLAADRPAALEMPSATVDHYRNLVREATTLFGSTHYSHYQFLWALTNRIAPDGIEHHESSDNRSPVRVLQDDDIRRAEATLLPHEYSHSWNGKYRRPIGLATPDYQTPMQDDLLWIYEGLTEYLGQMLAARSGLLTLPELRDEFARIAAAMNSHTGREWRSLQDANDAAPLLYVQSKYWAARLRRQEDFYQESALLWLEADALIRRQSRGRRSLDDFCQRFFGGKSGGAEVNPYDFDAVVTALNAVQPYDWRGFWRERLERKRAGAPLEGLRAAGWRLALTDSPSSMQVAHDAEDHSQTLQYSLGFALSLDNGEISDLVPGSPADLAGVAPGSKLVAVNGHKWSHEAIHDALVYESSKSGTVRLLVEKDEELVTLDVRYGGGERYPHLERDEGASDLLAQIAAPRAAAASR